MRYCGSDFTSGTQDARGLTQRSPRPHFWRRGNNSRRSASTDDTASVSTRSEGDSRKSRRI